MTHSGLSRPRTCAHCRATGSGDVWAREHGGSAACEPPWGYRCCQWANSHMCCMCCAMQLRPVSVQSGRTLTCTAGPGVGSSTSTAASKKKQKTKKSDITPNPSGHRPQRPCTHARMVGLGCSSCASRACVLIMMLMARCQCCSLDPHCGCARSLFCRNMS